MLSKSRGERQKDIKMLDSVVVSSRKGNTKYGDMLSSAAKEVRCVKFSPSVKPSSYQPRIEMNELESSLWTTTFASMGQLNALGLKEVQTFTRLNETPYHHCAPMARKFEAAYGPLARVVQPETKEKVRGHRYYAGKKDSTVPSFQLVQLPKIKDADDPFILPSHMLTGEKPPDVSYVPKSAIRIHWGSSVTDNVDLICDWLGKRFGPILFTIPEEGRRLIVVYKDIKSSYETVNAGIPPALMTVAWCYPKFYNYGHYSIYKNYKLSKDPIWQRGLNCE